MTSRPRAVGALIIGDEILTGKRADKHMPHVVQTLGARGVTLDYVQYLGDDRARLTAVLRDSLARDDVVFSFGGIGATPDDHTRQAAAAALGAPLALHPEARVLYLSGHPMGEGGADPAGELLLKPVSPDALARRVREVLDRPAGAPR